LTFITITTNSCTKSQPIDNGAPRNENESQNDKERGDRGGGAVVETNDAKRHAKALTLRLSLVSYKYERIRQNEDRNLVVAFKIEVGIWELSFNDIPEPVHW
jgi:hypothetical protein